MPEHPILKDIPENLISALKRRGWDLAQILGDAQQLHGSFEHGRRKYHNDMNVTDALRVPVRFVIDLVEVLADMGREIGRLEDEAFSRRMAKKVADDLDAECKIRSFYDEHIAKMPIQFTASDIPPSVLRAFAEHCEKNPEVAEKIRKTHAELLPTIEWDKPLDPEGMTAEEMRAKIESGEGIPIPKRIGPCGPSGYDVPRREPDLTEHDLMVETNHRLLWLDGPKEVIRIPDVDEATQEAMQELLDASCLDHRFVLFGEEPYRVTVRWNDLLGEVCEAHFDAFAVTLPHQGSFAVYIEADRIKGSGIPGIFARQAPSISEENRLDVIVRDMTTSRVVFHAPACWHRCSDAASYRRSVVIGFEYILGHGELCTLHDDVHVDASKRFHLDGCALWPKRVEYPAGARRIVVDPRDPRHIEIHAGSLRLYFDANSIEDHLLGAWFRKRIESQEVLGALHPNGYVFGPETEKPGPCDVKLHCRIESWEKGEEENCLTLALCAPSGAVQDILESSRQFEEDRRCVYGPDRVEIRLIENPDTDIYYGHVDDASIQRIDDKLHVTMAKTEFAKSDFDHLCRHNMIGKRLHVVSVVHSGDARVYRYAAWSHLFAYDYAHKDEVRLVFDRIDTTDALTAGEADNESEE